MPEANRREEANRTQTNEDVKKRAIRRVGAAVAFALIAAIGVTALTHRKPAAPLVEAEPTVLPAETPASAVQASVAEPPPVSAVAETPAATEAPPVVALPPQVVAPPPPPPPQVVNVPQAPAELAHKADKPIAIKPFKEVEPPAKPAPAPPPPVVEKAEKSAKPRAVMELTPVPAKEIAAKTGETKKPVEARPEPAKPASNTPPSQARAALELVPVAPVRETAPKDGELKKPGDARAEPAKPTPGAPPPAAPPASPPGGAATKGYAVQLGVFSNPSNAMQMQEKLSQHGIQSYTETKLNIGTFQNKTEADQTMAKVRGLGIGAVVVPLH